MLGVAAVTRYKYSEGKNRPQRQTQETVRRVARQNIQHFFFLWIPFCLQAVQIYSANGVAHIILKMFPKLNYGLKTAEKSE
jgi:hypothetical protein